MNETPLQEYVRKNGSSKITEELGIAAYEHPTLPLIGFKYDQLDSPSKHPVTRYSRGTVLEKNTYKVVAHPFVRFFNYGEFPEEQAIFDWSEVFTTSKEDGSLCLVYFYAGEWHVNTSGSFALGNYSKFSNETWRDLFWKTAEGCGLKKDCLNPAYTYVFELCTLDNKIVRMYSKSKVFLLSVFEGSEEKHWSFTKEQAGIVGCPLPETYTFNSIEQVEKFLGEKEIVDPTFEGVIIRDKNNVRFKVKSKTYLALHHLNENGNLARIDRLVQVAMSNETHEVLSYFPELTERLNAVKEKLDVLKADLLALWNAVKDIEDRKTFALAVKDNKLGWLLFLLKKESKENQTEKELIRKFNNSAERITEVFFSVR